MECPKCGFKTDTKGVECPRCGIIYDKFRIKDSDTAKITDTQDAPFPPPIKDENKYEKTLKEFDALAKETGDDRFFTKKELKYLPEILQQNESVLAFCSGLMNGNTWLIALTDRRIIFLDKGMLYGLRQETIPLNRVNSISCSTGLIFGKIMITDGAVTRKIENIIKIAVKPFTDKCQEAIEKLNSYQNTTVTTTERDPYEQLEKLASLKEKGIITQEEFDIEKQKILNK